MNQTAVILAIDQGTTSTRIALVNKNAHFLALTQKPIQQKYPHEEWVEQDALEIWQSVLVCLKQLVTPLLTSQVVAVSLSNQRETVVLWNKKTGIPVAPAIGWQDKRTARWCQKNQSLNSKYQILKKTGLILDSYFCASKLAWLLQHTPGIQALIDSGNLLFGTIDSWLVWNLSGRKAHVTDVSNASRTLLFNINTLTWDEDLLSLFGIPKKILPTVVPSSFTGIFTSPYSVGFTAPISGISGDQQASLFGHTCFNIGSAKNTYGTGCFMLMNVGCRVVHSTQKLLSTVAWSSSQGEELSPKHTAYALEGSIFMAGAIIKWLRDDLGIINHFHEVETLAREVPHSGGVVLVPAFTGLGAPFWDGLARASLLGMTRSTQKKHIARAALNSIALQTVAIFDAMCSDAKITIPELHVDGGACRNDLLMQIQADFLGVPVVRSKNVETTVLGVAFLAGLAVGFWQDAQELRTLNPIERHFEPQINSDERAYHKDRFYQAVQLTRLYK